MKLTFKAETTAQLIDRMMEFLDIIRSVPAPAPAAKPAPEPKSWRDLSGSKQAGIRCNEPIFWAFLREKYFEDVTDKDSAAASVRAILGVASRSELSKPEKRDAWRALEEDYQSWKLAESVDG